MNFLNMKPICVIFFVCYLTAVRMQISKMTRIITGTEAQPGQFPWQALIINYIKPGVIGTCGGGLINQEWVLTAAHCILDNVKYIEVKLGALTYYDSKEDGQAVFRIQKYFKHPLYNNIDLQNDICLIKLPKPVQLSDTIKLIGLPRIEDLNVPLRNKTGQICGWGLNSDGIPILHHGTVTVVSIKKCQKSNMVFAIFKNRIIFCAVGKRSNAVCLGDSGGPLVINNTLTAVVSFSFDCALGAPSAYTRTVVYVNWIYLMTGIGVS